MHKNTNIPNVSAESTLLCKFCENTSLNFTLSFVSHRCTWVQGIPTPQASPPSTTPSFHLSSLQACQKSWLRPSQQPWVPAFWGKAHWRCRSSDTRQIMINTWPFLSLSNVLLALWLSAVGFVVAYIVLMRIVCVPQAARGSECPGNVERN